MKRLCTTLALLLGFVMTSWAQQQPVGPKYILQAEAPHLSAPLSTLPTAEFIPGTEPTEAKGQKKVPEWFTPQPSPAGFVDPLWRTGARAGTILGPAPFVNVEGPSVTDNPGGLAPPDPNMAVGPNHVVASVNVVSEVFDKTGNSVFGPFQLNDLWNGFGGPCEADNNGDPVPLYDHTNDRFLLTQFAVDTGAHLCVAVSTTSDPTGSYFLYAFDFITFPDYPKFGLFNDVLLASVRNFGSSFDMQAAAFDYASMLVGDPATAVITSITNALGVSVDGFLPLDSDGVTAGPTISSSDVPGNFVGFRDATNTLHFLQLAPDFVTPGNTTLTPVTTIPVDPFDSSFCGGGFSGCIDQPAPGNDIDALSFFLMHRAAVRDIGGTKHLVLNHTVDVNATDRAGIRWYELTDTDGGEWEVAQSGTHSPDTNDRWMASISMNGNGDIAIGYSVSGEDPDNPTPPSIRYAAQTSGGPAGVLNITETSIFEGPGVQTGGLTRWGDYTVMHPDPSNPGAFWYINQYIPSNGSFNWNTRIAAFSLEGDDVPPAMIDDLTVVSPLAITQGASVTLEWTSVGDDGNTGTATIYDVRYSDAGPINDGNFDAATQATGEPSPQAPGNTETFTINELNFGTQYWFSVKALDEFGNAGPASNSPDATTGPAPGLDVNPTELSASLEPEQSTVETLTIINTGSPGSILNFAFPEFAASMLLRDTPANLRNNTAPVAESTDHPKGADSFAGIGHDVILGAGGPDDFGYEWIDSNEPGGPIYSFTDITGTGTEHAINDDFAGTTSVSVALPFTFPFYGEDKTSVRIDNNGFLFFDSGASNYFSNAQIPSSSAPNGVIAPFWDDLNPDAGACTIHSQGDGNQFIVQYTDCERFSDAATNVTFQVILNKDGSILFLYEDMTGTLASATVGIESPDGTDGLQVAFNTAYVENGLAVHFAVPPTIVGGVDPVEGSLASGESVDVDVTIQSFGLLPGNYEDAILLETNAPDVTAPTMLIPVSLEVAGGVPDIAVDPDALSFGDEFVGASSSLTFDIVNEGNGVLTITDVTSDNGDFTTNFSGSFMLNPGESETIMVTFAPSATGAIAGTISVDSSDPDEDPITVAVDGNGTPPPAIDTDPDALVAETQIGTTTTQTLTILNNGDADLEWSAMFAASTAPDGFEILPEQVAVSNPSGNSDGSAFGLARPDATAAPTPFAPGSEVYQVDDGTSENSIGLTAGGDVMWINAFQVIEGAESIFSIASTFGNASSGISNGTPVTYYLYDDPNNDGNPTDAVLLTSVDTAVAGVDTDAFLTELIDETTVDGVFFVGVLIQSHPAGAFPAPLDQSSPQQGASWVVGHGTPGGFNDTNLGANSLPPTNIDTIAGLEGNWLLRADGTGAGFVLYSPESGTVPPGGSQDVEVTFDATSLDVGTYTGNTEILSNDPVNPTFLVPTTLTVTAADFPFVYDPTSIDVELLTGEMTVEELNILNATDEPQQFDLTIEGESGPVPVGPNPLTAKQRRAYDKMAAAVAETNQMAPSAGPDPNQERALSPTQLPGGFGMVAPTGITAWGNSVSGFGALNGNFVTFDLGEPSSLTALAPNINSFAGDYVSGDDSQFFISEAGGGSNNFFSVDPATGAMTLIGTSTADDSFSELADDPTDRTLYASTPTQLYTIDPANGTATPIGAFHGDFSAGDLMIAIAIDDAGVMYGHEIENDVIVTIDKETAEVTVLGPTGVASNFAQGMDYDPITGQLYIAWYQGGGVGGLRTVDRTTGATTLVGPFQGDEISFLAIPGTPPIHFLDVSLIQGILNPGFDVDVDVVFDATGLVEGLYTANINIQSYVPGEPAETVPVSMLVDADPDIEVDPLALDFGQVFRNGQGGPLNVTITNAGLGALNISDISVDNAVFDLTLPDGWATVPPMSAIQVEVTFNPTEVGVQNGTLTIASDDANDPSVEVSLTGEGVPEPVIAVDPESFDLQAYAGQEYEQTLTISNLAEAGGANLDWTLSEENVSGPGNATFFAALLEEDFEGGIPGDWSVIDNEGNGIVWKPATSWGESNYTNGSGESAMVCSDCQSGDYDTELLTPPLATNGLTDYVLSFTVNYINLFDDQFEVDISTDGGTTWTNLLSWQEDHGGFFTPPGEDVSLDLAPHLTGGEGEEFIIRWHYFNTETNDWDWYAQIDDVKVQAPLTWLTEDVTAGSLAPGESQDITLSFSAPSVPGLYQVDLVFNSNDPGNPEVTVPVDFEVISGVNVVADTDQLMDTGMNPIDDIHPGQEFLFPVTVQSLDFLEILSYEFTLHFDPAIVEGVDALFEGTMSEELETAVNVDNDAGTISIAAADIEGAAPLTLDPAVVEGAGTLVYIKMKGGAGMHGTSAIEFQDSFQFNEGEPPVTTVDGEVEVTPLFGDATVNGAVNALDAQRVLQHTVGATTLTGASFVQGEVTGNGAVSALDASLILQYTVGMISCFPVDPACTAAPASKQEAIAASGQLVWGEPENDVNAERTRLPLRLEQTEGSIHAVTVTLPVDERVMTVEGMESHLPDDWQTSYALNEGVLRIVMAGVTPLGASDLVTLNVHWLTEDAQVTWTGPFFLNEEAPQILRGIEVGAIPETFVLGDNYPNPFNPVTTITYALPEQSRVTLTIYNALGQKVRTLVDTEQNAGNYKVRWDSRSDAGTQVASGTYLYRIEAGDFVATKSLILIK